MMEAAAANSPPNVSVMELQDMLRQSKPPVVLDVREPNELEICQIPGNVAIPLGQLMLRAAELPAEGTIVVYCHHGGRSARAVQWLRQNGFSGAVNLTGGIDAWAAQIAPDMQRY